MLLERPLPQADSKLWRVMERHAEALLAQTPEHTLTLTDRVRRVLSDSLRTAEPSLAQAASVLHMSERSLQRKLAQEGHSFDALLDELRRDLALRYLQDPRIAIAEIAFLLGYSEASAFHRAFKRWTGAALDMNICASISARSLPICRTSWMPTASTPPPRASG